MNSEVKDYLEKYPKEIREMFCTIRDIIYRNIYCEIEEKLWAKLPSYYVKEKYIRLIPFKDHLNIQAQGILYYLNDLKSHKITPKGILQIYLGEQIPSDTLIDIFKETLE